MFWALCRQYRGKGSTFTVTIPLALGTAPAAEEAEEQKPLTPVKPPFENHKILLLDDDPLQLRLLQEMLKKLVGDSWQVFACLHVAEALTVLHNEHPALMMMDIEMPEMNGIRMIQHINHSHMKVVAMTAHDASIIRELKEAGFDDCLFKPFSTEKLKEILGLEDTASEAEDITEETEDIAEKTSLETEDIAEKSSLETEDIAKKSNKNSRFAALLTFAEGDPEANVENQQVKNRSQNTSVHGKGNGNASSDNTQGSGNQGITDSGQRAHQRGFHRVDGIFIKIRIICIFLLHSGIDTHQQRGELGRDCHKFQSSFEGLLFLLRIILVQLLHNRGHSVGIT